MLKHLTLRRFVFIKETTVDFGGGFCALTGETGAGKSLLTDALALLAGARPVAGMIMPGADSFEIEAVFESTDSTIADFVREHELAGDDNDIIVRRIVDGKRGRAFINGRQVPLSMLGEIVSSVLEICGQHNHYSLRKPAAQRAFVDGVGGAESAVAVQESHRQWAAAAAELQQAREHVAVAKRRRDALSEELAELHEVNFSSEWWEEQNRLLSRLSNVQDLAGGGGESLAILEDTVAPGLAQARRRLGELAKLDDNLAAPTQCLEEAETAATEAVRALTKYVGELHTEPELQADAEKFVAETHRLARKYQLPDPSMLGACIAEKQNELDGLKKQIDIDEMKKNESQKRTRFLSACKTLSQNRKNAAQLLEKTTTALLRKLSMPMARLQVALTPLEEPGAHGAERVEILITTRKDSPPGTLADVASGGELSRLGLALQLAAEGRRGKPVMIFDEVDAGIGGAAASVVGALLQTLGQSRQVLCVTHLAQVAAHADCHWRVYSGDDKRTIMINQLSEQERVEELARIVGGATINDAARANAADLLRQSRRS